MPEALFLIYSSSSRRCCYGLICTTSVKGSIAPAARKVQYTANLECFSLWPVNLAYCVGPSESSLSIRHEALLVCELHVLDLNMKMPNAVPSELPMLHGDFCQSIFCEAIFGMPYIR